MNKLLDLLQALVDRPSITPEDAGCQQLLASLLERSGFKTVHLPVDPVSNLWAEHGQGSPCLALAGHTDVVDPGPRAHWRTDPFQAVLSGSRVFGRGVADMKGGLAALIVAAEKFVRDFPNHPGKLALIITSAEEGGFDHIGTPTVVKALSDWGQTLEYCLIGEPSSQTILGDTIRVGRRGSLNLDLTIHGKQGHAAYPERVDNPIARLGNVIRALVLEQWDQGNDYFPPTTLQFTHLDAGNSKARNVVPGDAFAQLNLRFNTEQTPEALKARIERLIETYATAYSLSENVNGHPFLTRQGKLVSTVQRAINEVLGISPDLSTSGGTSDGRFIAPYGAEVVELGPLAQSIHQVNEWVDIEDLENLVRIYYQIIKGLLL